MMKTVVKLNFSDEKTKQKVMRAVSGIPGLESIAMDPKDNKLTVTGGMDPVDVVERLRKLKFCRADIVSVGPAKEAEPKKVDPVPLLKAYQADYQNPYYYYQPPPIAAVALPHYFHRSVEEDPNACVIT